MSQTTQDKLIDKFRFENGGCQKVSVIKSNAITYGGVVFEKEREIMGNESLIR